MSFLARLTILAAVMVTAMTFSLWGWSVWTRLKYLVNYCMDCDQICYIHGAQEINPNKYVDLYLELPLVKSSDIHGSQRMYHTDFGDTLTFDISSE